MSWFGQRAKPPERHRERRVFGTAVLAVTVCLMNAAEARAQEPNRYPERAQRAETSQPGFGKAVGGERRESRDIVADNLDRVAASPEQLLDLLGKDPGLMVEFKRLLAEDAGASGQILEESDLAEDAIAERLSSDLHSRVLATRLLRRYGYLQPKANPGSDVAEERSLALQARTYALTHAVARERGRAETLQEEAPCDPRKSRDCQEQEPASNGSLQITEPEDPGPERGYPLESPPGETVPWPRVQIPQTLKASSPAVESPDAFFSVDNIDMLEELGKPGPSGKGSIRADRDFADGLGTIPLATGESASENRAASLERSGNAVLPTGRSGDGERYAKRVPADAGAPSGSMQMLHKSNPYADAPSLYDLYVQASSAPGPAERFGLAAFRRGMANTGALPMDLPVGPDYVVGPGDGLSIDLWGGVSQRLLRTVDREGRLALPEAGPLLVSGKSLAEVQQSVQRILRTQFRDVSADVSLLRLRTVRVYVVGEVAAPGAYDVSSLSTALNALFSAGGVTARGSLRKIEHFRGKDLLEEVDVYDLLLRGIRGDLQRLENGDSLRVPPVGSSVTVEGMVRRPASYELSKEKNLEDVLELAGGIVPAAALQHIEVQRTEAHKTRTMLSLDVDGSLDKDGIRAAFQKFAIQDGDEVHIFPIAPYNSGSVYLEGHVLRPGRYSYHDGMKLTDLISSYEELLPEPAENYAEIVRIAGPEKRPVVQSFNLAAALEKPAESPALQPLDTVRIFGRFELQPAPEILVTGEVRAGGRYRLSGQEHLRDAIYQAGGITAEAWLDSAQLFRAMPDGTTKVFSIALEEALAGEPLINILVQPGDRILVQREPDRVSARSVYIRGEVGRPGRYPLAVGMRVSDLVRSAGGTLRSADPAGAELVHYATPGTGSAAKISGEQTVDLTAALRPDASSDIALKDGDVLTVPQRGGWKDIGATVTLRGEVTKPGVYGIEPGERLSSLLKRAGGLLQAAYPQAAVFERNEVRKVQEQTKQELIQRLEQEATVVKTAVNSSGAEEAALQQAAIQQRQRIVDALRRAPVSGRLVVHIRQGQKDFPGSPDDIELRAGDTLEIPKQPGFVLIVGQVYNSNAITYTPGKNAGWYLSRAGGATALANKKAIFILRSNGAVSSGGGGMWDGGVLSLPVGPGDTIVVPERAVVGSSVWKNLVAIAQIAQAGALAAAVAIP